MEDYALSISRRFISWGRNVSLADTRSLEKLRGSIRSLLEGQGSPTLNPREFCELKSLLKEHDPQMLAEGILFLGKRAAQNGQPARAWQYLNILAHPSPEILSIIPQGIAREAASELSALQGQGPFGRRVEILSRNFVDQVTDPALLVGMGAAQWIGSAVRLGTLSRLLSSPHTRWWNRGLGARLTAASAAFVPEVGAFWTASRGVGVLANPQGLAWDGDSIRREWFSLGLTLGALRLSGGLLGSLHLPASIPWRQSLLRNFGMFGGIALGHWVEGRLGLRPGGSSDHWVTESLVTLLHFHVSGRLLSGLTGARGEALTREITERTAHLGRGEPPWAGWWKGTPQPEGVGPQGVLRTVPGSRNSSPLSRPLLMATNGSGGRPTGEPVTQEQLLFNETMGRIHWMRAALEARVRQTFPEFFEEGSHGKLPSETPSWDPYDNGVIDRQVREFLGEQNLPRHALQDPSVQESVRQVWRNPKRVQVSDSSLLQKTSAEIIQAQEILRYIGLPEGGRFRPSPLETNVGLNELLRREFYFLNDTGRTTGSFKERGAIVEVLRAGDDGAIEVVTASHGNHGLAVALAARIFGLRVTIVVPDTTPQVKVERLRALGGTVVLTGQQPYRGYEEARDWGIRYTLERNLLLEKTLGVRGAVRYIHGFEDVIPGQGVAGLEILEKIRQLPPQTQEALARGTFLLPMGGGGLAAGVATAVRNQFPEAKIIGVASDQAPALHHSLLTGQRSEVFLNEKGLCDSGIGLTIPGARPFEILREVLDGSMVVSDPLVGEAMRLIHRHHGEVVEGGAATGLAAALSGRLEGWGIPRNSPIVTILTGGNIDGSRHQAVLRGEEAYLPGGILDSQNPPEKRPGSNSP